MTIETKRILTITEPEKLFTKDGIKQEYRNFAKKYHTDNYATGSSILFAKINELHRLGVEKIKNGTWDSHELLLTSSVSGGKLKFKYDLEELTEYGKRFTSCKNIVFTSGLNGFSDMFKDSVYQSQDYLTKHAKMQENFTNLVPVISASYNDFTCKHGVATIIARPLPEFVSIQFILDTHKIVPHKQTAWMITRLLNLSILINKSGLVHNGITLNNVYVNIVEHTAALLDGWWYSTRQGRKAKSVPSCNAGLLSPMERKSKIPTTKFDIECIKQIGRKLETDDTPFQIKQWNRLPASEDALKELDHWHSKILIDAYREHKFVKWEI